MHPGCPLTTTCHVGLVIAYAELEVLPSLILLTERKIRMAHTHIVLEYNIEL